MSSVNKGSNMNNENSKDCTTGENNAKLTLYLNHESDRLKTFDSWTNKGVDKCELAKYGFFYKGPDDAVECVYCRVVIAGWDYGDNPLREHIQWSPSCPFLLHKAPVNVALTENFEKELPLSVYIKPIVYNDDAAIDQLYRPTEKIVLHGKAVIRHPDYQSQEKRLESFETWPKSLKQTPDALSEAGLYYLRKSDHVKCFYCGGALRDWDEEDEPWVEHAKHFQHCNYLKEFKGAQFIKDIHNDDDDDDDDYDDVSMDDSTDDEDAVMDDDLTTINKCNLCLVNDLNAIFRPCMHVYACVKCGFEFTNCPVCRHKITVIEKCYITQSFVNKMDHETTPAFKQKPLINVTT